MWKAEYGVDLGHVFFLMFGSPHLVASTHPQHIYILFRLPPKIVIITVDFCVFGLLFNSFIIAFDGDGFPKSFRMDESSKLLGNFVVGWYAYLIGYI